MSFPPILTGLPAYYGRLAKLLADAGHKVTVITQNNQNSEGEWSYPSVDVVNLNSAIENYLQKLVHPWTSPRVENELKYAAIGMAMRDWLNINHKPLDIDVIETHDTAGISAFFSDIEFPPIVVTLHGTIAQIDHINKKNGVLNENYPLIYSSEIISILVADEVITHTSRTSHNLERYFGKSGSVITPPFEFFSGYFADVELPKTQQVIGLVTGRLEVLKGVIDVLEALKSCINNEVDLIIYWAGPSNGLGLTGEPIVQYLETSYPELWNTHFFWLGSRTSAEVATLQSQCDFLISPSYFDIFNFTVIEAMSFGKPVILSDSVGAKHLCKHKENSIIIPTRDVNALADAMQQLAQNPEYRKNLGTKAEQTVREHFTIENMVNKRIVTYQSAVSRHEFRQQLPYGKEVLSPWVFELIKSQSMKLQTAHSQNSKRFFNIAIYNRIVHFLYKARMWIRYRILLKLKR